MNGLVPVKVSSNAVTIKNKTVNGKELCFYMVYPNPYNKLKYIGIIGYNNSDFIDFGKPDMDANQYASMISYLKNENYYEISTYGWNDYKIWNKDSTIVASDFNFYWNN